MTLFIKEFPLGIELQDIVVAALSILNRVHAFADSGSDHLSTRRVRMQSCRPLHLCHSPPNEPKTVYISMVSFGGGINGLSICKEQE